MGSAWYGSLSNPLEIDSKGITGFNGQTDFARSWTGSPNPDPTPPSGAAYGMDTSNTAAVSATEGIAFAWEIFRGGIYSNSNGYGPAQGQAMLHVTLGDKQPIATRKEGLLWGSDKLDVGSMTLFNPGNAPNGGGYIYMYSNSVGTYSPVVVGRVPVASAFDHTQYRFLKTDGTWDAAGTIPNSSADGYGMSGNPQPPVSNAEGSIMYNQYLSKYMLFTSTMETSGGFYLADTPYGPWGQKFEILSEGGHYGMNCHPELLPGSNGQTVLVSWGTSSVQTMYKLSFAY